MLLSLILIISNSHILFKNKEFFNNQNKKYYLNKNKIIRPNNLKKS